jgi:heme-degrading monooxygenase HmoA
MSGYHLAQFNVAWLKKPLDHPDSADFKNWIDPIHALADQAPGFVWRLVAEGENSATSMRPVGEDGIINFTVWESREAMAAFVYRKDHADALRRRRDWFRPAEEANVVMWWIPAGHIPTLEEALERLEMLRRDGPSPRAFTYREFHDPEPAAPPDHARA